MSRFRCVGVVEAGIYLVSGMVTVFINSAIVAYAVNEFLNQQR